jgi:plastocyanin
MIYTGITPAWLASIEAEAQQQLGITIDGNEGSATKSGITISWVYDPAELTLTVGDTHKPWFISESKIDEELTALVNSSEPGA